MDPAELKKLRSKQRKAAKRAAAAQEAANKAANTIKSDRNHHHHNQNNDQNNAAKDGDENQLNPEKLARVEKPLEEALRFLRPLQDFASGRIETHLSAFEIQKRRDKPMLMLLALNRARAIDPTHPRVHANLVYFCHSVCSRQDLPEAVGKVIAKTRDALFTSCRDTVELNERFLAQHSSSYPHLIEGARMMSFLTPSRNADALRLVTRINKEGDFVPPEGVTIENCEKVLTYLRSGEFGEIGETKKEEFLSECLQRFPWATAFRARLPLPDDSVTNNVSDCGLTNSNHTGELNNKMAAAQIE